MNMIIAALSKLDASNETHWTSDGLPRIDAVRALAGDQNLSREDINKAAPGFSRANNALPGAQAEQAGASGAATSAAPIAAPAAPAPVLDTDNGGEDGEVHQEAEAGDVAAGTVSERAALEAELAAAQERLAEIEQAFVRAEAVRSEARAEVDRCLIAIDKLPQEPAAAPFHKYLASQARELEQRAQQRSKLRESNVDLKALTALTSGAPIDNARARQKAFGALRSK